MQNRVQSKAARLRLIEHLLYNSTPGLRVTEIADQCGVDRRTIYRDLPALEDMGVPVWEREGRYGIERTNYLSTIRLNLNEAVALFFAARLLTHHSDEHNPHVVGALNKLAAGLPDETISLNMARLAELIRARPLRGNYIQVLETVTRAWADRRALLIRYRDANGSVTARTIHPYLLEVARNEPASYVIGYDTLRRAIRTFKLERVVSAEIEAVSYSIPPAFDAYSQFASAWGVIDDAPVLVRLRFSAAAAPRVRESVWHHSQRLAERDDGGCELTMEIGGTREIRAWVLGWGMECEVIEPAGLRAEVVAHAAGMLARYGEHSDAAGS